MTTTPRLNALPALALLALLASSAPRAADASTKPVDDLVRVWDCRFDNDDDTGIYWDVNYDAWPDRWTRVYDDDHPRYASIGIEPSDDESVPGAMLVVKPDGASATVKSPPIRILPKFSYKLQMRARLRGAEHGKAVVRIAFCAGDERRQVESIKPLPSNGEWRDIELGDYQPRDSDVDRVYVEIDYVEGERGDLHAEVSVADLRLFRLPSIRIQTDSLYNVYTDPTQVRVTCSLSGISRKNPEIRFQLFDATEKSIGQGGVLELDGKKINESRARASDIVDGFNTDRDSYEGSKDWRPPIQGYGFYRVKVGMYNPDTNQPIGEGRSISLAVVKPDLDTSERGEFGWALPEADYPLDFSVLKELLPRVGVRMVKLPVWYQPGDEDRADEIVRFAEQLATSGIETIGVLEDPTLKLADPFTRERPEDIEGLLANDPSYWTPLIDHVITRLSLRIRWWQLGRDGDTSFVGYQNLVEQIMDIRNKMFRFGQDIRLGLGWRWDHAKSWRKPPSWDYLQMSGRELLDAEGLDKAFRAAPENVAKRWVVVAPPDVPLDAPEGVDRLDVEHPLMRQALVRRHELRVRDFVEQILVAKIHGADGIFVTEPFSGSTDPLEGRAGVMNDDGSPGELLLPWRTCARLLGGADYLGTITLPYGSKNWLFKRPDGRIVMVLWNLDAETPDPNSAPINEVLYLGENVQIADVWGDTSVPEKMGDRHVIPVGRMPRFVIGLNEAIARWRMAVRFKHVSLPSVFGVPHPNELALENRFTQGVGGRLQVFVPSRVSPDPALSQDQAPEWDILLRQDRFSLASGQSMTLPIEVSLREASYGPQVVRVDFEVAADREYRFSAWRELRVGDDGLELGVISYISHDGRLVVEQRMKQASGQPADFKCLLYVKGRRRKRTQVYQLGPGLDRKRYTYLNPDELIGKEMRLWIEEVEGRRVLIQRFTVDPLPEPPPEEEEAEGDSRFASTR